MTGTTRGATLSPWARGTQSEYISLPIIQESAAIPCNPLLIIPLDALRTSWLDDDSVGERTLIGASGEYSDFQYIMGILEEDHQYDVNMDDGFQRSPSEFYSMLRTIMYNRRCGSQEMPHAPFLVDRTVWCSTVERTPHSERPYVPSSGTLCLVWWRFFPLQYLYPLNSKQD